MCFSNRPLVRLWHSSFARLCFESGRPKALRAGDAPGAPARPASRQWLRCVGGGDGGGGGGAAPGAGRAPAACCVGGWCGAVGGARPAPRARSRASHGFTKRLRVLHFVTVDDGCAARLTAPSMGRSDATHWTITSFCTRSSRSGRPSARLSFCCTPLYLQEVFQ